MQTEPSDIQSSLHLLNFDGVQAFDLLQGFPLLHNEMTAAQPAGTPAAFIVHFSNMTGLLEIINGQSVSWWLTMHSVSMGLDNLSPGLLWISSNQILECII